MYAYQVRNMEATLEGVDPMRPLSNRGWRLDRLIGPGAILPIP